MFDRRGKFYAAEPDEDVNEDEGRTEQQVLADYITEGVKKYWREYDQWVKGKREEKPEENDDIRLYWKVQSRLRAERRRRENQELYEYQLELEGNRRDPNIDLDYWGTRDVAQFFHVSPGCVLNWRKQGWISGFQPNGSHGHWMFNSRDFTDMVIDVNKINTELRRFIPRVLHHAKHQGRQG